MKSKEIFLSVIIPCYNEEANLDRGVLDQVRQYLEKQKFPWEVIISDDGSTDRSLKIVSRAIKDFKDFRVLKNKHGGKPWAVWQGVKAAKGEWVLFTDMDQSTPIDQLKKLLPWTRKGFLAIIGSRGVERKNFPFFRKLGALVFRNFRKILLLRKINDTQCGFKLFKTEMVRSFFPKLDVLQKKASGWTVTSYDVELLFMISKSGRKIKEVVVDWQDRDVSTSKGKNYFARYFKESKDMTKQVIAVRLNERRGKYNHLESKSKN
ncbi:MAG: glycosyltransferase [Patescibacteria group bacterium]|nr:glycosyltransferase [Patescibacteria group bacterium]